ncbi:adenine phosphoribosyltransferase [Geothrix sp. 21YS21S-4]|uniref:adenine phosphoribosyltransferase n=1 Tax=Geothrix sp. 21YS21S-4 TaxID=3068889 RepID=UPI0027B9C608|nr:adenine phosphoribosyltransferase [Geothrix sp. 21YS21S-4]
MPPLTSPLAAFVRDVPDFPKAGILFKDITPLLADAEAFGEAVAAMAQPALTLQPTHVLGLESRGFIFGSALAQKLGVGFVPARKPGKLPRPTHHEAYGLEYGSDALEIHTDAFGPGDRVLIVDDVMATGGTAAAAGRLVKLTGAQAVGLTVFIELASLPGREQVEGLPVFSVLRY